MQDRFKFRVWNKEQQKLYFWEDLEKSKGDNSFYWCMLQAQNDEKNNILMQCTGLKDKNGKLIYEGDILQENWHKYILEWGNGAYVIKDIKTGTSYMFTSGLCIEKSEVIGNIYENIDLLEVKNEN